MKKKELIRDPRAAPARGSRLYSKIHGLLVSPLLPSYVQQPQVGPMQNIAHTLACHLKPSNNWDIIGSIHREPYAGRLATEERAPCNIQ